MPLSSALFLPLVLFVSVVTFESSLAGERVPSIPDTQDPEVSSAQPDNNVSGNSGYITSPNYPEDYPNDFDYEVTVTLDQAGPQTVELTLDDFIVEFSPTCSYDYVIINGNESNKLCGVKNGQNISVDVPGDTFTVKLHTDASERRRGFNISYKVEQEPSATPTPQTTTTPPPPTTLTTAEDPEVSSAQPDNNVSGNSGYITSPNYPEDYPNDFDYEVTVTLDQAGPQTVELTLDDFIVEFSPTCPYDYVIINGNESNKLCGVKNGQNISVDVPGDTFTVKLHTDASERRRGFNISYKVEQDEKACSIRRHGTLTMFNGETTDVELPCKYRLADFTCGDYRVKVTPGSAVDEEDSHRFSPDTVSVKVVNANTNEFVKIRTSVRRLDKFSENRTTNPWQVKDGSKSVVDFADYDQSRAAAVLRKDGVFSVEFSSAERSVVVTCSDQEFVSEGLPESLCGDETTTDAMNNAMTTLFPGQGNMTDDALVSYIVLNHDNVVQSATCKDLASKFTSCQDKDQAAMECVAIFADPSQAECLATSDTSLADYFYDCLTSVCDGDTSAVDPMNNYISDNCGSWLEKSCDSDGDCPDGINATCFEGKCLCTPGYYYSNGQAVCVEGCPVADQQGEFLLYPNSVLHGYSTIVPTADTVEECLAACAADSNCPTVNFVDNNECAPNSITPLQDMDAFELYISVAGYADLYQKRCA